MNLLDRPLTPECPVRRVIRPGEYIYVACNGFYVRAKVDEVVLVLVRPGQDEPGLWAFVREDGVDVDLTKLTDEHMIVNIMPWTDWPLGHAAYIGDEGFFSLDDARREHGRYPAKGKYRRARRYLRHMTRFVASTWGGDHPGWPPLRDFYRRVYV